MDPINYLGMVPQVDLGKQFLTGLQAGAGIGEVQQQAEARQLALQQKQIAQQRAAQYQTDVGSFMQNPTPQGAAALQLKYPEQYEPISKAWAGLSADQQKNELQDTYSIASTLHAGRSDLALQQIDDRIQAHKNSGLPTADLEALRTQVEKDPIAAYGQVLHIVSALPGGDKILSNLSAAGQEQRAADAAPAELSKKQADAATAAAGVVGQAAGALAKPGVKPSQVITMFKSLEARGVLPKGGAQGYIDGMPTRPEDLPDYLKQVQASGMSSKDQMAYTTPTADAQLSADTQRRGQDITANTAAARLKFDKDQAEAENAPDTTSDAEKKNWVHQYVVGNGSVPRSAPANVRNHIGTWAAEMGITPADLASGSAQAKFDQASAVTSGHRAGSMASVEATMPALVANARELSNQLDQGRFVPWNQLSQMAADKISDPKLTAFKVAHQAVVSEYQQVISRGGTNVTALREAMHVLNSAKSREAYNAALDQVNKEVAINVAGTRAVRAGIGGQHGAAPAPAPASPTAPALPAGWTVKVH